MYDAYFEDRGLIPEDRYCEVRFDDLERDPFAVMRDMYDKLSLSGFIVSTDVDIVCRILLHTRKTNLLRWTQRPALASPRHGLATSSDGAIRHDSGDREDVQRIPFRGRAEVSVWGSLKEFQEDAIGFLSRSVSESRGHRSFSIRARCRYLVNRPEYVEQVLVTVAAFLRQTDQKCGQDACHLWRQPAFIRWRTVVATSTLDSAGIPTTACCRVHARDRFVDRGDDPELVTKASSGQEVDIVSEMMRLTMTIAAREFLRRTFAIRRGH